MKCNKVKVLLNRYIDKELAEQNLQGLIEEHLRSCPRCQAELKALAATKDLFAQKEKIAVGEDFLERIKERLEEQPQIIRIKWLPEAGELARRLIPVPVITAVLIFALVFGRMNGANPVDEYIFEDLTNTEIGILSGEIDNSELLNEVLFS